MVSMKVYPKRGDEHPVVSINDVNSKYDVKHQHDVLLSHQYGNEHYERVSEDTAYETIVSNFTDLHCAMTFKSSTGSLFFRVGRPGSEDRRTFEVTPDGILNESKANVGDHLGRVTVCEAEDTGAEGN